MGTEHFNFYRRGLIALVATFCVSIFLPAQANAGFSLGDAASYAVIYEGAGSHTLQINSSPVTNNGGSTILGNIGLASLSNGNPTAQFNNPAVITGNINFASPTASLNVGNAIVNGTTNSGVSQVNTDMIALNSLSATLGAEAGSALAISIANNATQTVNVASGTLDGSGNDVFTVSSMSFVNGGTLIINGSASQFVVLNFDFNTAFGGTIKLTGGITPDQVLFNVIGGMNLISGDTIQFAANANQSGTFLDPNGKIQANEVNVTGHLFGGDSTDMQIQSGGTVTVPEPSSYALVGVGLAGLLAVRRRKK